MKKLIITVLICFPLCTSAQSDRQRMSKDSIKYYQRQLSKLWRKGVDSIRNSEEYLNIVNRLETKKSNSGNYWGVSLFFEFVHTNYNEFNKSIIQHGFKPLKPIMRRTGIGISDKYKRRMLDFYFAVIGFNTEVEKGNERIESGLLNVVQFNWGYDLLDAKKISIYPYAGASIRISYLNYSKPPETNPNYTDISNLILRDQSTKLSSTKLGYQLGVSFDFSLGMDKDKEHKTILFIKVATDNPVGEDKYKTNGVKYKPDIKHGDWLIGIGLKFGNLN